MIGFAQTEKGEKMPDMMMFPDTVEEFMEQYKIVDSDEVYTNGAELIPIFRMKQWFEHVDAEPIRHGHWVDDGQRFGNDNECAIYECDQCGETIWVYLKDHRRWNYCPQCGSKMSEEVYIKLQRKDEVAE